MTLTDVLNIIAAAILSLGGGGLIVIGLSSWLGKVWANRLMEADRAQHAKELERLRAELRHDSETGLASIKSDLEIYKEKHLRGHADKLLIYRLVTDVVVDILGELDMLALRGTPPADAEDRWDRFNRGRMKAYGYLAMLAPQSVMDALDALIDHLILVTRGDENYKWPVVRTFILKLLNEIRKDVGIDATLIEYRGML